MRARRVSAKFNLFPYNVDSEIDKEFIKSIYYRKNKVLIPYKDFLRYISSINHYKFHKVSHKIVNTLAEKIALDIDTAIINDMTGFKRTL